MAALPYSEYEWDKLLEEVAKKAAEERTKYNKSKLKVRVNDGDLEKYTADYKRRLAKQYPYADNADFSDKLDLLNDYGSESTMKWLDFGGIGPEESKKQQELSKFAPLLTTVAEEGSDWQAMPSNALLDKAVEMGYSRSEYPQFLEKLRDYQTTLDRANILDEAKKEAGAKYVLGKLLAPSYMQEAENAILSGQGGEPETLDRMMTIDMLANVGTALAPGLQVVKNPYISGLVAAAMQGGAEAWRQKQKEDYSTTGQKFEWTPVIGGAAAGATVPGMIGTFQQVAGRVPGEQARAFSRGLMKSSKYGDPVFNERNYLERLFNEVNGFPSEQRRTVGQVNDLFAKIANTIEQSNNDPRIIELAIQTVMENGNTREQAESIINTIMSKPKLNAIYDLSDLAKLEKVPQADKILKFLGNDLKDEQGNILVDKAMEAYDQPYAALVKQTGDRFERLPQSEFVLNRPYFRHRNAQDGAKLLSKEAMDEFRELLPAKYEDLMSKSGWRKGGEITGAILSNIGGRVEPVIKINPFNIKDDGSDDYKSQSWYKKLNKDSKKIIEDAFRRKKEEAELEEE